MTTPPGAERADETVELLRALVQEARQHTLLLAQIADELAALRRPAPPAGARGRQDPPGGPSGVGRGRQAEPGPPPEGPLDVQDLAAVLPGDGGGVHLHAAPEAGAAPVMTVRAGSIVHVLEERDGWVRVATREGTQGWVRVAVLGEV